MSDIGKLARISKIHLNADEALLKQVRRWGKNKAAPLEDTINTFRTGQLAVPEDLLEKTQPEFYLPYTIPDYNVASFGRQTADITAASSDVPNFIKYNPTTKAQRTGILGGPPHEFLHRQQNDIPYLRGTEYEKAIPDLAEILGANEFMTEVVTDPRSLSNTFSSSLDVYLANPMERQAKMMEGLVPHTPSGYPLFRSLYPSHFADTAKSAIQEFNQKYPRIAKHAKKYAQNYLPAAAGAVAGSEVLSSDDAEAGPVNIKNVFRGTPKFGNTRNITPESYELAQRSAYRTIDNPIGAAMFGNVFDAEMDIANIFDPRYNPEEVFKLVEHLGESGHYARTDVRRLLTGNWDSYERSDVQRALQDMGYTGNWQLEPTSIQKSTYHELNSIAPRRYQDVYSTFDPREIKIKELFAPKSEVISTFDRFHHNGPLRIDRGGYTDILSAEDLAKPNVLYNDEPYRQFAPQLKPILEEFAPDAHFLDENYERKDLFPAQRGDYVSPERLRRLKRRDEDFSPAGKNPDFDSDEFEDMLPWEEDATADFTDADFAKFDSAVDEAESLLKHLKNFNITEEEIVAALSEKSISKQPKTYAYAGKSTVDEVVDAIKVDYPEKTTENIKFLLMDAGMLSHDPTKGAVLSAHYKSLVPKDAELALSGLKKISLAAKQKKIKEKVNPKDFAGSVLKNSSLNYNDFDPSTFKHYGEVNTDQLINLVSDDLNIDGDLAHAYLVQHGLLDYDDDYVLELTPKYKDLGKLYGKSSKNWFSETANKLLGKKGKAASLGAATGSIGATTTSEASENKTSNFNVSANIPSSRPGLFSEGMQRMGRTFIDAVMKKDIQLDDSLDAGDMLGVGTAALAGGMLSSIGATKNLVAGQGTVEDLMDVASSAIGVRPGTMLLKGGRTAWEALSGKKIPKLFEDPLSK